jgi:hypothetical protein
MEKGMDKTINGGYYYLVGNSIRRGNNVWTGKFLRICGAIVSKLQSWKPGFAWHVTLHSGRKNAGI